MHHVSIKSTKIEKILKVHSIEFGDSQETAAEAEISWLLVPLKGQAPEMLDPIFPIMQHKNVFL